MATPLMTAITLLVSILAATGFLFLLRRRFPPTRLRASNEATLFYITVTGTFYAVIVAFMLSTVWGDFQDARSNVEREANSLVNLFRLANGLADPQRVEVQKIARVYASVMTAEEWRAMEREQISPAGVECIERLWQTINGVEPIRDNQRVILKQMYEELGRMTEYRRMRQIQSRTRLPGILWIVLIFGGVVTVANSCLLGVESSGLHALYIVSLTGLVTLSLAAISDINRPFEGFVHVPPDSFEMALSTFDRPLER